MGSHRSHLIPRLSSCFRVEGGLKDKHGVSLLDTITFVFFSYNNILKSMHIVTDRINSTMSIQGS